MRILLAVMMSVAWVFAAHAEDDFRKILDAPTPFLEKLESQIKTSDRNDAADKALAVELQSLAYAINQEIIAADSPSWLNPSHERKEVIAKWAELLTPYTQSLLDLAFGDGFSTSPASQQSRSVLDFAPATPVFADQVRPFLKRSAWVAFAAADLLYEHRLLHDTDKQILRDVKPNEEAGEEILRWAKGVSSFEMTDGLEAAKRCLASTPTGESLESIVVQYRNGLAIATALGEKAIGLLPHLEALIANPIVEGAGYHEHFEYARDVVSGKQPRQGRVAKNGSGPLSTWLVADASKQTKSTGQAIPQPSPKKQGIESKPSSTLSQQPASPTPWSIIVALMVAAVGLLLSLLKRRS